MLTDLDSYAIAYWLIVLNIDGFVAGLAYIVNVFLASLAFGVCTGTIGFISAYIFVRRLYSSLKVMRLNLRTLSSHILNLLPIIGGLNALTSSFDFLQSKIVYYRE